MSALYTTIVDAATLQLHLADPDWRVIDVRHQLADTAYGERVYGEGHIPGAVFLHCDRDLSGTVTGCNGRHPLPDPQCLAARLDEIGIGEQTQVVIYDDAQGMIAGRLWWLLRWLGHRAVAVLDGGFQVWQAAGGEVTTALPAPSVARFPVARQSLAVNTDFVQKMSLTMSACALIDARSPDRFRGENETIDPVGGHIPGAINHFFRDNLQTDGCFKPADQLRLEWLAVLADCPPDQVVHYCGSGVSACHNLLALEIAGLPGGRLYGGSWSEWCADTSRPVA